MLMDFSGLLVYQLVTSITPGPNNLMCMYLGAQYGIRGSRRFLLGSFGTVLVKTLLCGLLNVMLAAMIPRLIPWLKWAGAAYMLYLAWTMLKSGRTAGDLAAADGDATCSAGILLQLLNIKSWVAALSMFSVYVVPYTTAVGEILLAALVMELCIVGGGLCWCLFGRAIQGVYQRYRFPISVVMALSLVYCAVSAVL